MAQFTERLGGVNNRIGVQDPGPQGPGAMEALSTLGSSLLQGAGNVMQARRNNQARRAEQADTEFMGAVGRASTIDRIVNDPSIAIEEVPQTLRPEIERFRASRARAEQTGDWSQFQTQTERLVMRIEREAPDRLPEMFDLVEQLGGEHYLFRAERGRRDRFEADQAQAQEDRDAAISYARTRLLPEVQDGMTPDRLAVIGTRMMSGENRIADARARVENEAVLTDADRGAINSAIIGGATEMAYGEIAPAVTQIAQQIQSGQLTGQQRVAAWQQTRMSIEAIRSRVMVEATRAGADNDAISDLNTLFDSQLTIMDRYVQDETAQSVIDGIINNHKIDFMTAVPALGRLDAITDGRVFDDLARIGLTQATLRSGMSEQAVDFFMNGYNEDVSTVIRDEAGGPTSTGGRPSVRRAEGRLKEVSTLPINEASDSTVEQRGPAFIGVMMNLARRVVEGGDPTSQITRAAAGAVAVEASNLREQVMSQREADFDFVGSADTADLDFWSKRYRGMQEHILTRELAPNQFDPRQFAGASDAIFGGLSQEALRRASETDPQLVRTTFDTGRTMLDLINGYRPSLGSDSVDFNPKSGRYEVSRWEGTNVGIRSNFSERAASEANRLLDRIINISDLDSSISEAGLSEKEARTYYATGVLPDDIDEGGKVSDEAAAREPESDEDYTRMVVSQEGGSHSTGYIPTAGSGVTIGAGLDLGQWSQTALRNQLGLSPELIEKLRPYIGLTTQAAVEAQGLDPASLELTPEEETELNQGSLEYSQRRAQQTPAWDNLDQRSREAVVSIRHWAGFLSADSSKLAPGGQNYLWPVLSREDATREDIVQALRQTLADMPDETEARYNRVERLIRDLS